jgi:hypothetical protein
VQATCQGWAAYKVASYNDLRFSAWSPIVNPTRSTPAAPCRADAAA